MLREAISIVEGSSISARFVRAKNVTFEDVLDWLDANGKYESLDQYAKGNLGIKSNWINHESIYELSSSDMKKFQKAVKGIGTIEEVGGNVDFKNIKTNKEFDKLDSAAQLATVWYALTKDTSIQPSNIKDLKVKVTSKKALLHTNSNEIDVGEGSESGVEKLPFDLVMRDLKNLVKEVK